MLFVRSCYFIFFRFIFIHTITHALACYTHHSLTHTHIHADESDESDGYDDDDETDEEDSDGEDEDEDEEDDEMEEDDEQ